MEIRKVAVKAITPTVHNPRVDLTPEDPEYQDLKKSIISFGYVEPIIWNRQTGNLVGGHQRYKILIEQGLTEIEASVVDLPLEKEKALNVALNKIQGRWDEVKLAQLLDELTQIPDMDVTATGFDLPEISHLIDQHLVPKENDFDFLEAVEAIR
jgi:ParB-like chromosome segregation protein Spo0J